MINQTIAASSQIEAEHKGIALVAFFGFIVKGCESRQINDRYWKVTITY